MTHLKEINRRDPNEKLKIAVIGSGISGMSAAWMISQSHDVHLFEKDDRIGGHSNTVTVDGEHIDTGFIVYNERNYPNLVNLLQHLNVGSIASEMSFAVSASGGKLEYSGADIPGLFAQRKNIANPQFWRMIFDILRFFKQSRKVLADRKYENITLGKYLQDNGYSDYFRDNHLVPMGAAIWSTPLGNMLEFPVSSFVRFCDNHGLLQVNDRPLWRTVEGGSQAYVAELTKSFADGIHLNRGVRRIERHENWVEIEDAHGIRETFDHVVLAGHGDQTLPLLADASPIEERLLGAFRYQRNLAILHSDPSLMPKNRKVWSSWNYLSEDNESNGPVCVTYWMNHLQRLEADRPYLVTLNPIHQPAEKHIHRSFLYDHFIFDQAAMRAQRLLWNLQGLNRTWFCGSYFGYGFHEDGLQSGLAVGEALSGRFRPWQVADTESANRVFLPNDWHKEWRVGETARGGLRRAA